MMEQVHHGSGRIVYDPHRAPHKYPHWGYLWAK